VFLDGRYVTVDKRPEQASGVQRSDPGASSKNVVGLKEDLRPGLLRLVLGEPLLKWTVQFVNCSVKTALIAGIANSLVHIILTK
jgi:hypothetical protein